MISARLTGEVAPDLEALGGRVQRVVEIGAGRMRHRAEDAFIRSVDDGRTVTVARFAVDIELQFRIRRHGLLLYD